MYINCHVCSATLVAVAGLHVLIRVREYYYIAPHYICRRCMHAKKHQ